MQIRRPGGSIALAQSAPRLVVSVIEPLISSDGRRITPRLHGRASAAGLCENAVLLGCFSNRHRTRVDSVLALRLHNRLRFRFLRIEDFRDDLVSPDDVGLGTARFWHPPARSHW